MQTIHREPVRYVLSTFFVQTVKLSVLQLFALHASMGTISSLIKHVNPLATHTTSKITGTTLVTPAASIVETAKMPMKLPASIAEVLNAFFLILREAIA